MINFGSFYDGYNENEKILAAKRKENAALYSDFVKSNPGASADEREKFANSLAGNNKSFRAILPSREMMESNVAEYNRKKAAALAATARKQRLQDIDIANKATGYFADLLQTTDANTASKMTSDLFGDLLKPELLPAVQAQAKRVGWAKFQQDAAPLIQNFQNNPTQANLDSLVRAGFNTEWGNQLKTQYAPQLDRAKTQANAAAAANIMGIAQKVDLDDDNVFRSQLEAEFAKWNDLLSPDQKATIEKNARDQLEARRTKRTNDQTALATQIANNVFNSIGEDGFQNEKEIQRQLEAALAQNSDLLGYDTTELMKTAATLLDDQRQQHLDAKNKAERDTITKATQDALEDRGYSVEHREYIKNIASGVVGKAGDEENRTQMVDAKTNEIENVIRQLGGMGINLKDADVVAQLAAQALDVQQREMGTMTGDEAAALPLDIKHVAQAYDEMLLSGTVGPIEKMAVASALEDLGFRSISEAVKSGRGASLTSGIQTAMKELYTEINDIYGDTQTTIDAVVNNVNNNVITLQTQIDELGIGDLLETGLSLIDTELSVANSADMEIWQGDAKTALRSVTEAKMSMDSEITRLRTLARDSFYNVDQNAAKEALARADKLEENSKTLSIQANALAKQLLDASQRYTIKASADVGQDPEATPEQVRSEKKTKYTVGLANQLKDMQDKGQEIDPAVLFGQLYTALENEQDKSFLGMTMRSRFGGQVDDVREYGPFVAPPDSGIAERLSMGNIETVDYLPFMLEIFEDLGLQPPTPTELRHAMEGVPLGVQIDRAIGDALGGVGDYFKYVFTGEE